MADKVLLDTQFYSLVKMSEKSLLDSKMSELVQKGLNVHKVYGGKTTAIHVASEYGNVELVRLLLETHEAHDDVLKKDEVDEDTAIHAAAIGGKFGVLSLLEQAGFNVTDVKNKYDHTPLHHALGKGRIRIARHLIRSGAKLESPDWTGASLLHFAARKGSIGGLNLLTSEYESRMHPKRMNFNESSTAGLIALHYAAWNGQHKAVEWLLKKGSSLEMVDHVEENTALHWAAMRGHRVMVAKLVEACVRQGVEVFKENKDKKTALEVLENYASTEEVHAFLELVQKQGLLDMKAFPPMVLVKYAMGYGDSQMIQNLKHSLNYAAEKSSDYRDSLTQLLWKKLMIWLAEKGNKESVPLLMDLEQHLPNGFLPRTAAAALNKALLNKNTEFAYLLARQGKEKKKLTDWLKSMKVHLTGSANSLSEKLNKKGKDRLNLKLAREESVKDEIPLAFWIFQDHRPDIAKIMELHSEWGSFVNEQGPLTGRTALHWAYIFDRTDIVKKLQEVNECQADIRDKELKTPTRYAVERRKEERQVFVDALNAIVVGATLVASLSFTGLVQPPTGRFSLSSVAMKVFWPSNTLSFFLAMASALVALRGVLPMPDTQLDKVVFSIQRALLFASALLVASISFALLAFGAAGLSQLPSSNSKIYMIAPTVVGGAASIFMVLWFFRGLLALSYPKQVKPDEPAKPAADSEADQDVAADPVREPKYKVGPRFSEYPWEDGLDAVYVKYRAHHIP